MPIDEGLQQALTLWKDQRYYQAIALLGGDSGQPDALPSIGDAILAEIRSSAVLEAAWLDHLLSGTDSYEDDEVLMILTKRQTLETVVSALRRLDLRLDIPLIDIDQAIRDRFASRRMAPATRRIYHNLYLTAKSV